MICYETTTLERKKRQLNYSITAFVGMTGFEPATTRPPHAYSNRTELHPESLWECKGNQFR